MPVSWHRRQSVAVVQRALNLSDKGVPADANARCSTIGAGPRGACFRPVAAEFRLARRRAERR